MARCSARPEDAGQVGLRRALAHLHAALAVLPHQRRCRLQAVGCHQGRVRIQLRSQSGRNDRQRFQAVVTEGLGSPAGQGLRIRSDVRTFMSIQRGSRLPGTQQSSRLAGAGRRQAPGQLEEHRQHGHHRQLRAELEARGEAVREALAAGEDIQGFARGLQRVEAPRAMSSANGSSLQAPRMLDGLRVCLIEDDQNVLMATATLLQKWGCEVATFSTLPDASAHFDLVVTDFDLGLEASGADCIAHVRALNEIAQRRGQSLAQKKATARAVGSWLFVQLSRVGRHTRPAGTCRREHTRHYTRTCDRVHSQLL